MRLESSPKVNLRRTTLILPAWSVPPRVLLVEDDPVCRMLSERLLKVFGCTIDVAVDGMAALVMMNMEKYDLVLMVRLFSSGLGFSCAISC